MYMYILELLVNEAVEKGIDDRWIVRAKSALRQTHIGAGLTACKWHKLDDDGEGESAWKGSCGGAWYLTYDGTPYDHNMLFCHFCGGSLVIVSDEEE